MCALVNSIFIVITRALSSVFAFTWKGRCILLAYHVNIPTNWHHDVERFAFISLIYAQVEQCISVFNQTVKYSFCVETGNNRSDQVCRSWEQIHRGSPRETMTVALEEVKKELLLAYNFNLLLSNF